MSPRVTMRDVASAVGVSPMTVSRGLRGDKTVSHETRDKVREAARKLGYVSDTTAQAFRTQKSGFVAVTLPSINNANFAETYHTLSDAMAGMGMQLLLGATDYQIEKEEELVRQLLARNPEALVVTGGHHTPATRDLIRNRGLPVVEIWDMPTDPLGHVVGFSNVDAMRTVVAHLADKGRRRLAFVGASEGTDMRGAARRKGVVSAAQVMGLPDVICFDAGTAPASMRQGAALVEQIGHRLQDFDALVCVSDPVAFGVLNACRRLGIEVPEQLAITGFGNFEVAAVSEPQITTVDVRARLIGENVAQILGSSLSARPPFQTIDVGARLVPGRTS